MTIEVDGDTWKILSLGVTREDGKTIAHLASTTRFRQQNNGKVPVQRLEWMNDYELRKSGWWPE